MIRGAAVLMLMVLAVASCRRDRASTGTATNPFVFVVSSSHATPEDAKQLEAALKGITVRVRVVAPGAEAVKSTGMASFDAGLLPLFEYLLARQEYDVHAGLQVVRDSSKVYRGAIVVHEDAAFQTLADLRGRKVAFVDRTSTTGYLLAWRALRDTKVDALMTGSHAAAVAAVLDARADAAATFVASREGLRVLAETGSVPNEPVFFSSKTPREVRDQFVRALVDLAATPEGRALLQRMAGITGFEPVTDDEYRTVHELLRETDNSVADLVPGGQHLVEWNNVPLSELGPI